MIFIIFCFVCFFVFTFFDKIFQLIPEYRISILLTIILDENINKYPQNFKKIIDRLNKYYETNKVDIINYFIKLIMYIPTKITIYANELYNFGKSDIINNIFKKLIEELNKMKNSFIFIVVLFLG